MPPDAPPPSRLLGDDPRDGSSERPDELGREAFALYLAQLIENVREQSESSVMALIGDWGSGKTSILKLLHRQLVIASASSWLLAEFNPWTYPDAGSLQRGFFNELTAALPRNERPTGARAKVGELARTLSPIGKLGGLVGVDAEGMIRAFADVVAGDMSASAAQRAAEEALRRIQRPVLMVIDDLDRLTPDELLEVLKLVRLVGRLPHVYYLLSYDERTLLDVLKRTPVAGDDEARARAYLEKIVQVRLDMPSLRWAQRASLLERGLTSILSSSKVALSDADRQRLDTLYSEVLDRRLTTPRAISRFLGQVQAFYMPLRGEVDFVDFFLLSWLRTQEPGVHAMLHRERDAVLGRDGSSLAFRRRDEVAIKARRKFWLARLKAAQVSKDHQDGVIQVLSDLFPDLRAAFDGGSGLRVTEERATPMAVSNTDYFDRYFVFGVPEDDLPDSTVARALRALEAGGSGAPALQRLARELKTNTGLALRKIDAARRMGAAIPESALFGLLARTWSEVEQGRQEIFADPWRATERAAASCLLSMETSVAVTSATEIGGRPDGANFVVNVVRSILRAKQSPYATRDEHDRDIGDFVRLATQLNRNTLVGLAAESPFEDGVMRAFWAWDELEPEAAHEWLRQQVDRGVWRLEDVLGALTSVATVFGESGNHAGLGDFQLSTAVQTFGRERLYADLSSQIDGATPLGGDPLDIEPTPANRVRRALLALKKARAEQPPIPAQEEPGLSSLSAD